MRPASPARPPALAPCPLSRCQPGPTRQPLSPSLSLSLWQAGPACQRLPRARDRASDVIATGHCSPRRLANITLTNSVWRLAAAQAIPSPRLPEPSRRLAIIALTSSVWHLASPSPPWQPRRCSPPLTPFPTLGAYKRTVRAPSFSTPALATPSSLPRARLSQRRRTLPPLW
jgi:hypothetical protein